jgi:hypothetical protein
MEDAMSIRFGELLGRLVPLSGQDVEEILEEQKMTHRRFGQIALSWGLCQPEHLWQAWCDQLAASPEKIDLQAEGIDTQALSHLPVELADQFCAIPVRCLSDRVIIAVAEDAFDQAAEQLPRLLGKRIQLVMADAAQIAEAVQTHYRTRRIDSHDRNVEVEAMRRTA